MNGAKNRSIGLKATSLFKMSLKVLQVSAWTINNVAH